MLLSITSNWHKGHSNLHCHLTSLIYSSGKVNACPPAYFVTGDDGDTFNENSRVLYLYEYKVAPFHNLQFAGKYLYRICFILFVIVRQHPFFI
jgi:hypothetical protein